MASDRNSSWGKLTSTGLELAAGIGLGVAIGYWIDQRHSTGPVGVIVGFFVGFAAGIYLLVKELLKSDKD